MKLCRVALVSTLVACNGCAPLPAYRSPIEVFGTQTKTLAESVGKALEEFSDNQRIDYARWDVRRRIDIERNVAGQQGPQPKDFEASAVETLLCVPRDRLGQRAMSGKYLLAVSASLTATVAAPSDDIMKLLSAMRSNYTIAVPTPQPRDDQVCRDDLNAYSSHAYPGGAPELLAIAGLVAGVQALWSVFKPVVTTALQQVDAARRAEAIQRFVGDATNVDRIKKSVNDSVGTLTGASKRKRYLAVMEFVNARDELTSSLRAMNVRAIPACNSFLALRVAGPEAAKNADFRACYRAVWSASEAKITAMVTAGKAYDAAAATDPSNAGKALLEVTDKLSDIANGKITDEVASAMFQALIDLYGLAEAVNKDLHDPESQKKVSDAVKLIRQSL